MVQAAELWNRNHTPDGRQRNRARDGRIFAQRQMCSRAQVVRNVVREHAAQPRRVHHDDVIKAFTSDRANDALYVGVLPR
jgi:hypothetical protein